MADTISRYDDRPEGSVGAQVYHDAGLPPPAEAGSHTLGGRCVRIDDESGITRLDYDESGRLAQKLSTPEGNDQTFRSPDLMDSSATPISNA